MEVLFYCSHHHLCSMSNIYGWLLRSIQIRLAVCTVIYFIVHLPLTHLESIWCASIYSISYELIFEASPGSSFSLALSLRFRLIGLDEHSLALLRPNLKLSASSPAPPAAGEGSSSELGSDTKQPVQSSPAADADKRSGDSASKSSSRRRGELPSPSGADRDDKGMGRPRRRRGAPRPAPAEQNHQSQSGERSDETLSRARTPGNFESDSKWLHGSGARALVRRSQHENGVGVGVDEEQRALLAVLGGGVRANGNESLSLRRVYERTRDLRCVGTVRQRSDRIRVYSHSLSRPPVFCLIAYFLWHLKRFLPMRLMQCKYIT